MAAPPRPAVVQLPAPPWVYDLLRDSKPAEHPFAEGVFQVRCTSAFQLISVQLDEATSLDREALGERVHRAYLHVAELLASSRAAHPVRFWNHIPLIHADMGAGLDRYMAFNIGRHRAFCDWYGGEQAFGQCIATASGVGCRDGSLVLHVLASDRPGIAVANPRQIQPFAYSKRFGPRPPCFARATVLPQTSRPLALIGGTASIRGEDSVHLGDLQKQLAETFENLDVLLGKCGEAAGKPAGLASLTHVRAYIPNPADTPAIHLAIRRVVPGLHRLELLQADLCRRELLVEIEGLAEL